LAIIQNQQFIEVKIAPLKATQGNVASTPISSVGLNGYLQVQF
jgi:hypothetical protein